MAKTNSDGTDSRKNQNLLVFIVGAVLLLIVLATMLFKSNVDPNTFWVVRLIATLGAAGFGALIPGYLKIEGTGWKAGGAVAFGALAYFFNPPPLSPTIHDVTIQGVVYVNDKAQPNVDVKANEVEQQKITNMFGKFIFTIPENKLLESLTFDVKYRQTDSTLKDVDTTIRLSKAEFSKPDFEIRVKSNPRPPAKNQIAGYVWNEQGTGLAEVNVSAAGSTASTDAGGYFSIYVVTNDHSVPVNFSKNGFISRTLAFNPPNRNVSITLKKQ